jgi:ascorbate-specific PTS system EIIC-type component UlaA
MKSVMKLLFVFGLVMLVIAMAFTFTVLLPVSRQEVLLPILSAGILLAVWYVVTKASAIFTKRYTTATGLG